MRKYRKQDEWKSIGKNIAERRRAGNESDVLINGSLIRRSKVQKQIRRYTITTEKERNLPGGSILESF